MSPGGRNDSPRGDHRYDRALKHFVRISPTTPGLAPQASPRETLLMTGSGSLLALAGLLGFTLVELALQFVG